MVMGVCASLAVLLVKIYDEQRPFEYSILLCVCERRPEREHLRRVAPIVLGKARLRTEKRNKPALLARRI